MKNVNKYETFVINSPVQGEIVPLTRVNDQTFSKKMIGDGFAVKPTDNNFYSPIDGRIILADRHAICIESANGTQILIHIGIDSIKLPQELKTFVHFKRVGDIVKKGDKLIYANLEDFPANNLDSITSVIILNESIKGHKLSIRNEGKVTHNSEIISIDYVEQYVDDELLAKDEFIFSRSKLVNELKAKLKLDTKKTTKPQKTVKKDIKKIKKEVKQTVKKETKKITKKETKKTAKKHLPKPVKKLVKKENIKKVQKQNIFELKKVDGIQIHSPVNGEIIQLSKVKDETFSQKMIGDGFAVKPSDQIFYAPIDGKIILVNNHAISIETKEGIQILIHIGIDTVTLDPNLKTFIHYVKVGDRVKQGDKLVKADLNTITKNNLSTVTPVIILKDSLPNQESIKFIGSGKVSPSTSILLIDDKKLTNTKQEQLKTKPAEIKKPVENRKQKVVETKPTEIKKSTESKKEKPVKFTEKVKKYFKNSYLTFIQFFNKKNKKQKVVETKPTEIKKPIETKKEKPVKFKEKVKKYFKNSYLTFIQFCKKHKIALLIWYIIWVVIIVAIFGIIYSVDNPNLPA